MNQNLTILRKGLVLVSIPLVFQLVFLGLVFRSQADVRLAQGWALHTKEVIAQAESIYRRLVEGQSTARAAILTGDLATHGGFGRSLADVSDDLTRLRHRVRDNPRQQAQVDRIAGPAADLIDWQEEARTFIALGYIDLATRRARDGSGRTRLDRVRREIDAFLAEEERLDRSRTEDLDRVSRRQGWAILVGGGLALVATVGLLLAFSRGFSRRFLILIDNARRVGEGKELRPPQAGRDEIAELDRTIHAMARSIAEKDRENEMFIYSVSHDLRSPLVNLQGFSQELGYAARGIAGLLRDDAVPGPIREKGLALVDGEVGESIHFIRTAVSRLSVIIDALLRLSRAGRVEYRFGPVDVGEKARRVVEALGATIAERGASVTIGPLPEAWGDPTAIEQVFANLAGNAIHYLDPARPGVVEIGAADGDDPSNPRPHSRYYVKDNGLGIPDSAKAKLFGAFQRFHEGRARGEGIGLALVRKIVERHGGRIWAESTQGVGSTFFVELPSAAPPAPRESSPDGPSSSRRRERE